MPIVPREALHGKMKEVSYSTAKEERCMQEEGNVA
jgi:hypothetical protein